MLEKMDLEEVASFVCGSIGKKKRFSHLSQIELCSLWKGVCRHLAEQLLAKKSINLHGIGSFFTKKTKHAGEDKIIWSIHFSPGKNWDKLPGFNIDRTIALGTTAAEPLSLASVSLIVGLSRETVEAGLKDISNGLVHAVRKGIVVCLSMGTFGMLNLLDTQIKVRFFTPFIKLVNEENFRRSLDGLGLFSPLAKQEQNNDNEKANFSDKIEKQEKGIKQEKSEKEEKREKLEKEKEEKLEKEEKEEKLEKEEKQEKQEKTIKTSHMEPKVAFSDIADIPKSMASSSTLADIKPILLEKGLKTSNSEKAIPADLENNLEEAGKKLAKLESLIAETFSKEIKPDETHTHYYSGNRLWKNNKCPICKTKSVKNEIDTQAQLKQEKENDKMLLHIALDMDKKYLDERNERENKKRRDALEAAQYNRQISMELKAKLGFKEKQPMGDLFEKRKIQMPVMSSVEMAAGINQQIAIKKELNESSLQIVNHQEKLMCEKLRNEIHYSEIQAHNSKTQKCHQIHASLSEQIRLNKGLKDEQKDQDINDNPFARSESLMALYHREKSKQLYYEQLAIVRQKREYALKIAEIEKKHSLAKLAVSRKELERDLKNFKKEKIEVRKNLECYWSEQVSFREKMKKEEQERTYLGI